MSCGRVVMNEGHEVPFRGVWDLCCSSIDKEFRFKEGLIFIVIISLVRIWWVRQFVCWGVNLSWDVFYDEIIFLKVGMPSCRSSV